MQALSIDIPWAAWPEVRRIVSLFETEDVGLCFYGGALRNAVLGTPPADFDTIVASNHAATVELLKNAKLPVTVLDDLTVRTEIGGWQFDFLIINLSQQRTLPSFEKDARARVAYVDFTLNGFSYFPPGPACAEVENARSDLALGRLCFVGDPDTRINERIVYILRFFRFYAWYGHAAPDAASLAACVARAPELPKLAREFARREVIKLLAAPRPYAALQLMHRHDVLKYAVGFPVHDCERIGAWERAELACGAIRDWRARAAVLTLSAPLPANKALAHFCSFLGLAKQEAQAIERVLASLPRLDVSASEEQWRECVRRMSD